MNIKRYDFGEFVIFVNIFTGNNGGILSHHHDDLLSYVLYYRGLEVLIDPGLPAYFQHTKYKNASSHNGIWCENSLLRPLPRFFTPAAFFLNAIRLYMDFNGDSLKIHACNRYTGDERVLNIRGNNKSLKVYESYKSSKFNMRLGFTHCFADQRLVKLGMREIHFANLNFLYSGDISITKSDRAFAYGEPGRFHYVTAEVHRGEFSWEIHR